MSALTALDALQGMAIQAGAVLLILLFLQAAWHKFSDYGRFLGLLADYRLLPELLLEPAARLLLLSEALCALLLVWPVSRPAGAVLAASLLLLYALAIAINLLRGRVQVECGCGGAGQPLSWWLVLRNALLLLIALACALAGSIALEPLASAAGVLAGLLLWGSYSLTGQVFANLARLQRLRAAHSSRS